MRIWILSSTAKLKCYENERFREEAKKLGIKCRIVIPEKFEIVTTKRGEKCLYYTEKPINYPDVLIPRYTMNYFSSAVVREFEKSDTLVLNKSRNRELAKDKLAALQFLSNYNIPIPKTIVAKFPLNIDFVERSLEYPILIKKTQGSEGKGIILCENRSQLEDIFELMESSINTSTNLILQEFVKKSYGKDIRVFVVGGRAIGAILRQSINNDFKSNVSGGGIAKPFKLTPEIEWIAVESANAIGLDVAGVDILFDEDGYKVSEVNASPYFQGFEQATGINVPLEILNYISLKIEKED